MASTTSCLKIASLCLLLGLSSCVSHDHSATYTVLFNNRAPGGEVVLKFEKDGRPSVRTPEVVADMNYLLDSFDEIAAASRECDSVVLSKSGNYVLIRGKPCPAYEKRIVDIYDKYGLVYLDLGRTTVKFCIGAFLGDSEVVEYSRRVNNVGKSPLVNYKLHSKSRYEIE